MGWTTKEDYFSGQGVVLAAARNPITGKPLGFSPVGNVPELKLAVATSVLEHKESTTGARATDIRLTTETKVSLSFIAENFSAKNLARAVRASFKSFGGAAVVDEAVDGFMGAISALDKIKVSAVTVKQAPSTALTPYVNDTTPWDYQVNADAGSIKLNDGSITQAAILAETITAVTVGATTSLAIATSKAVAGGTYVPRGLTGADAALLNGIEATVVSVTSSAVVLAVDTTAKTITATGTPKGIALGGAALSLLVSYTYAAQKLVDALTAGSQDIFLRFEGLNTLVENSPVIVEIFRASLDPLKELSLISDTVQQFTYEGSVLADTTRPAGTTQFFNVKKLT